MIAGMLRDGVHAMAPCAQMVESARKLRDTYARAPGIPLFRREFGFYCLDRWKEQGMPQDIALPQLFQYDAPGDYHLGAAGGTMDTTLAPVYPPFEIEILEDRGDKELVLDSVGRHVLYFKGRRDGFMPQYVDHPVKDMKTWVENVKWRLDPSTSGRYVDLEARMDRARAEAARGLMISQLLPGAYMYLRSLIGPEELLYAFYDMPEVIHDCLQTWLVVEDGIIARHQEHVTLDEIYFDEDICFNHGPLISPRMIREFLFPYYQQLVSNVRARQIDQARHLYVQVDSDGFVVPIIPLYREGIGMDVMSPFEVAAGCDVVEIGKQYPWLTISGGIDKRVLAKGKEAIDAHVEYILPTMRKRGGYIPTCDHGVPEEVSYENYRYYRRRCLELGG